MPRKPTPKNLRRAEVILKVRAGLMSATEGAKRLGVSRKTYYEWEKRGLSAMMEALEDGQSGRPRKEHNPVLEDLRKTNTELELHKEILQTRLLIQKIIHEEDTGQLDRDRGKDRPTRTSKKKP